MCIQMKELLSGSFEICDDLHVHEKVKAIYAEIIIHFKWLIHYDTLKCKQTAQLNASLEMHDTFQF